MADFKEALRKTLDHEGVRFTWHGWPIPGKTGHVNHPSDPGRETNYGITTRTARAAGYRGAMARIPYHTVMAIYRQRYWDRFKGSQMPDQAIAAEVFDTAVNCGVSVASKILQDTLNAFGWDGKLYPLLKVDGKVGRVTIKTLRRALRLKKYYPSVILKMLDSQQATHYRRLIKRKPKLVVFFNGWMRWRCGVKA